MSTTDGTMASVSLRSSMGSAAVTADGEIVALDSLTNIQNSLDEVFQYCAANNLELPQKLKQRLKKELAMPEEEEDVNNSARSAPGHLGIPADSKENPYTGSLRPGCHRSFIQNLRQSSRTEAESVVGHDLIQKMKENAQFLQPKFPHLSVRVKNGKYVVTNTYEEDPNKESKYEKVEEEDGGPRRAKQKIETVTSAGIFFKCFRKLKRCITTGTMKDFEQDTTIIENINLMFEPGKMVLMLGGPGSGKTSILRYIANILPKGKGYKQEGTVSLSGIEPSKQVRWPSLIGFMDQIDRLHPFLTVSETCEFAWKCRTGGTHRRAWHGTGPEVDERIAEMDEDIATVKIVLEALGLTRVKDTFVGDQERVRGVSGGEKRRVTVAEMLCIGCPVLCCDEISTGLDAATTYDITLFFGLAARVFNRVIVVSLLQPPPETVANFDELVLVSEGRVIYAGPLEDVIEYFNNLGYDIPERMDMADWLQALPTQEGLRFLRNGEGEQPQRHLTPKEFSDRFYESPMGQDILKRLEEPEKATEEDTIILKTIGSVKYANGAFTSLKLLAQREVLLWWRDKYQIKAKIMQTVIVGVIVGTLFWQTDSFVSIISALFQSMFYACVAQMTSVSRQFPERSIFYKHQDANFFPTYAYVFGKSVASIPIAITDALCYGTVIYFFVGLAYNEGASIANYFMFLLLMFTISLTTGLFFMIYSASVRVVTIAQAMMALTAVLFTVFCGFTVQPDVIPVYYIWIYWINFFAWVLRGLAVNEFDSGKYDDVIAGTDPPVTQGQQILTQFGFVDGSDEPYRWEWAIWGFLVTLGWALISMMTTIVCLKRIRFTTGASLVTDKGTDEQEEFDQSNAVAIPFTRVDLTFKNICYTVMSSITKEELKLLNGIDGVIESGKMTALMGSSGAGKTTLMDVLALRKSSGEIEGEVRLNGHLQEEMSFRRCAGYVEQFDMQSPQLTIRETVDFSARLRLDEKDPAVTPETRTKFVEQILDMLELTNIQDLQVGSDATGGLSFEQKKRLSIAVEVVSNPSILFLDEPTSGLDARAAAIVMRGLKRIAESGRCVCATIHQPSVAIFSSFDSLLLLKRGGEVVFHGELGEKSQNLIDYFEMYDRTPKIQPGENPATWMLTTIGAGSSGGEAKPFDYAGNYVSSKLHTAVLDRIDEICSGMTDENKVSFSSQYATAGRTQALTVLKRTMTIYYRTPSYNTVRMIIAVAVALIFSTVYIPFVPPTNESTLNSIMNSIYISMLFLCVNAMNTVLALFEFERNMFYRHKAAGMYFARATVLGFTLSEIPFIFTAATLYTMLFYWILGFRAEAEPFFWFWAFAILTLGCYTCIGQMLVACLRDAMTAQGFGSLIVMGSSLFGGILLRPSEIPSFWIWMYWIMPGHYFFEGLIVSQYHGDETQIEATVGSVFWNFIGCENPEEVCYGTADEWVQSNFTDWSYTHLPYNILYLVLLLIFTRAMTFWALAHLNYRST